MGCKRLPVMRGGPVNLCLKACKAQIPINSLALRGGGSERDLLCRSADLVHMVTGTKAQKLQRGFEGMCPCPSETRPDDLQSQITPVPACSGRIPKPKGPTRRPTLSSNISLYQNLKPTRSDAT
jgi:hypothetical protein